jgi:signal transduction histidine kinase
MAPRLPFKPGPRLLLSFVVLILLIVGGNLLLVWQFHRARLQTDRLTGENQQLIAVLRLQESLRAFHQRLNALVETHDARRLASEAAPLRRALVEDIHRTRDALRSLAADTRIDPAFLPTLEAIEIALPAQLDTIASLAGTGDWDAVRRRLDNELRLLESETASLVKSIDDGVSVELSRARANMESVQRRILVLVPATAVATFAIAAFFGWAITRRIADLRAEERLDERTRIARDLHDTLLQGFISASLQLHVAADQVPDGSPARPMLDRVIQLVRQVIDDGRDAVRGFRSADKEPESLEQAFARMERQLPREGSVAFRITVDGRPGPLDAVTRDEVIAIGREALLNALRHAAATAIDLRLSYAADRFGLLVHDDGRGIEPAVLSAGRDGHFGLAGMRERAQRIGARLDIRSTHDAGTEVELSVPAGAAFPLRT